MADYYLHKTAAHIDELLEKVEGLNNYDDTEVRGLINNKVDKVTGKGLSTNDFTDAYKGTLDELSNTLNLKADLENGKVPSSQLPSYVDDVVEYASASLFPATGESGKIYLALDMNRTYRWSGSEYIPIPDYNIWIGTSAQYSALVSDDYDLYFIKEGSV